MSKEDMKGKYGEAFQGVADYENKYDITMCQAPKAETACWCKSLDRVGPTTSAVRATLVAAAAFSPERWASPNAPRPACASSLASAPVPPSVPRATSSVTSTA
eukprot:scaffold448830_cov71-Attheya_sp.AAC.1